jgi:hypothetical protein
MDFFKSQICNCLKFFRYRLTLLDRRLHHRRSLDLMFCWPASCYSLITRANLIHFTITFTLLKLKASTFFGHHLPILRRHCTNTVLVGVACCCRSRLAVHTVLPYPVNNLHL